VPIFPRHPITLAQQAQVVDSLAPGRARLGLGPSGRAGVEGTFGLPYGAPIGHLREYITILKSLLQEASVDFDGKHYKARSSIGAPVEVKVIGSALSTGAFEMCGAVADGAISWCCPHEYLQEVAMPAMQAGARNAGRGTPALIAHAPVCVHDDLEEARDAVRRQLGGFASSPYYANMFAAAGFPNSAESGWTDGMLDAVLLTGDEEGFRKQLDSVFERGATEVYGSIVTAGADSQASHDRTLRALASYSSG
jgi:alkanesulfonate monooxygenase SsuD/methylene tetrahydromethanopterin reductase-like flavin-dependent oxidoreductase (luciferase family)